MVDMESDTDSYMDSDDEVSVENPLRTSRNVI